MDRSFESYDKTAKTWFAMYIRFMTAHYITTGLAITLAAIIATDLLKAHGTARSVIALILAIDTGFIGAFGFESRANRAQRAWRLLRIALTRYVVSEERDLDSLLEAYERGEDILHETQGSPDRPIKRTSSG